MMSKPINILKSAAIGILLAGMVAMPASAQFLQLNLHVDSHLSVKESRLLKFKSMPVNSGQQAIEWGSVNMGTLSISVLQYQALYVKFDKPRVLHNVNNDNVTIPDELHARYGYSRRDYKKAQALPDKSVLTVQPNGGGSPWSSIYFFLYGSLNVQDIPAGIYTNHMVLTINYL